MDQCTENFECLVINNNAKSNKLNDQVFWYRNSVIIQTFRIGASALILIIKIYNPEHEDTNDFKNTKKNFQKINVKKIKK